jgi:hypothetical protein
VMVGANSGYCFKRAAGRSTQILISNITVSHQKPLQSSPNTGQLFSATAPARPRNAAQARTTHSILLRLLTRVASPILFLRTPSPELHLSLRVRIPPLPRPRLRSSTTHAAPAVRGSSALPRHPLASLRPASSSVVLASATIATSWMGAAAAPWPFFPAAVRSRAAPPPSSPKASAASSE